LRLILLIQTLLQMPLFAGIQALAFRHMAAQGSMMRLLPPPVQIADQVLVRVARLKVVVVRHPITHLPVNLQKPTLVVGKVIFQPKRLTWLLSHMKKLQARCATF
jgi:hypothetical protein